MNNDTISLLQECSAGANMAMSAIDQVLEGVENPALRDALTESRRVHDRIGGETRSLLRAQGQEGKAANPVAQEADRPPRRRDRCRPDRRRLQHGRQIPDALSESVSRRQRPRPCAGRAADRRGGAAVKRVTALSLTESHKKISLSIS